MDACAFPKDRITYQTLFLWKRIHLPFKQSLQKTLPLQVQAEHQFYLLQHVALFPCFVPIETNAQDRKLLKDVPCFYHFLLKNGVQTADLVMPLSFIVIGRGNKQLQ